MSDAAVIHAMEFEIRELLTDLRDPEAVARHLVRKYEILDLAPEAFTVLAGFFLRGGFHVLLVDLCVKKLMIEAKIPWGHFGRAVGLGATSLPLSVKKAIVVGAQAQQASAELARSHIFDDTEPDHPGLRSERRQEQQNQYRNQKKDLLTQLEMFRSQELEQEEERIVEHLLHLFPQDREVLEIDEQIHERKAVRLLEKKLQERGSSWERAEMPLLDIEERKQLDIIAASMMDVWKNYHQEEILGHDFAIALLMWDHPDASLDFLPERDAADRVLWTRLEALLMARQFVNLLNEIELLSLRESKDPDRTFALLYLKALALWGLGHRFAAVEIIEGIVSHRPNYRSAMTLLHLWKGGST